MKNKLAFDVNDINELSYDELIEHMRLSKTRSDSYVGLILPMKEELRKREPSINYQCSNCQSTKYAEHQGRSAGGLFSSAFDIGTMKLRMLVCNHCNKIDMYKADATLGEQLFDFLV